jgi:hypothetical protein
LLAKIAEANTSSLNWSIYKYFVGKPEGKKPLGRSRHRWKDNIRMDPREIDWEDVDWIRLVQDRDQ